MKTQFIIILAMIGTAAGAPMGRAQHGHLDAGAGSTEQGAPLIWANADDFVSDSGYIKTLNYTDTGRFAGYYEGNITLTALPATPAHAGPHPMAPVLGSYVQFSLSCLSGPEGGSFGFWDVGSTTPSISLAPGESSTDIWPLTESDGSPGADPYGHIHGRRFTATKAGIYKIGFTAVDTSANGEGGGPIHAPSEELPVWFQAGVNIASLNRTGTVNTISFGAPANQIITLEYLTNLSGTEEWKPIEAPVLGDDHLHSLEDPEATGTERYYRLHLTTPQ